MHTAPKTGYLIISKSARYGYGGNVTLIKAVVWCLVTSKHFLEGIHGKATGEHLCVICHTPFLEWFFVVCFNSPDSDGVVSHMPVTVFMELHVHDVERKKKNLLSRAENYVGSTLPLKKENNI